jgi:hypothetical protein
MQNKKKRECNQNEKKLKYSFGLLESEQKVIMYNHKNLKLNWNIYDEIFMEIWEIICFLKSGVDFLMGCCILDEDFLSNILKSVKMIFTRIKKSHIFQQKITSTM